MTRENRRPWAASEYEEVYARLFELWPVRAMFQDVVGKAELSLDTCILDIGSGTGFLLRSLMGQSPRPAITELDGSDRMLAQARLLAYDGPVEFFRADLNRPVADWGVPGKFDCFITVNSLYTLSDPRQALQDLADLATPDARLIVSTPRANPDMGAVLQAHLRWIAAQGQDPAAEHQRILRDFSGIIEANRQILARSDFHFPTEEELRRWFSGAWHIQSFGTTYADQNWLVKAERRCPRGGLHDQGLAGGEQGAAASEPAHPA
jgi:SAM-dependent methyltransferase